MARRVVSADAAAGPAGRFINNESPMAFTELKLGDAAGCGSDRDRSVRLG